MDFNEYEVLAMRTANPSMDDSDCLIMGGLGVSGEAGEISDMIKKVTFHGHSLDEDELIKEIGDVLWYLALLSKTAHTTLEEVAKRNIKKLENRYPNGFTFEASINRRE